MKHFKYFYDLEFLENGVTIEFISIGIVGEDGREYYAVSEGIMDPPLYDKIRNHRWIMENVISQLPLATHHNGQKRFVAPGNSYPQDPRFTLDANSPHVLPLHVIAKQVQAFLYDTPHPDDLIELWAWYGAYDHVRLMQLWGSMMKRPARLPMWTHDLNQYAEQQGFTPEEIAAAVPQTAGLHNALADARHLQTMWHYGEAKP